MNSIDAILALKMNIAVPEYHVNNIIFMIQEEWAGLNGRCGAAQHERWHGKRLTREGHGVQLLGFMVLLFDGIFME